MKYARLALSEVENIPAELAAYKSWICWREDAPRTEGAKPSKTPIVAGTGKMAGVNRPSEWATQAVALAAYKKNKALTGIGFVFSENDPFVGVDLDNCRSPETGVLENWALELVRLFNSYTEVSPSQSGVKIILRGSLAGKENHFTFHGHEAEVYGTGRYFAFTGRWLKESSPEIENGQEKIDLLIPNEPIQLTSKIVSIPRELDATAKAVDEIPDEILMAKIEQSAQGAKFKQLMSGSTAGYAGYFAASGALCSILAAWTRCNAERIDRLYRTSGLYEESWWTERAYSGGRSRAEVTIAKNCALTVAGWMYDPTAKNGKVTDISIECVTANEIEPELIVWLWENRIPQGKLTVFCGVPDTGKSTIAIDIVARGTRGKHWADSENSNPVFDTLMLIAEDDLNDTIVPRLMAAGADLSRVHFAKQTIVTSENGKRALSRIALDEDLNAVRRLLAERSEIRLIVIDPLGSYLGKMKKNCEEDIRSILTELKDLAERAKVSIISIDHFNKNAEQSAIHRLSGAGALAAVPRAVWAFVKDQDDPEKLRRLMLNAKLNVVSEAKKVGLAYRTAGANLLIKGTSTSLPVIEWLGGNDSDLDEVLHRQADHEKGKLGKCSEWLAAQLEHGPSFSREIYPKAANAGFSKNTVRRAMAQIGIRSKETQEGWKMSLPEEPGAAEVV